MTTEDQAAPEISENEAWYDAEIAPALAELARRCEERGMSFIANVEYQPGERGGTYTLAEDAGIDMRMVYICCQTAPNVDSYISNVRRMCKDKGIDISSSWYLTH